MKSLLIKNGQIVTEKEVFFGDIYTEDELIKDIGENLNYEADRVIDANGKYVLPGGIDAHTHMELPVMGTFSSDDFYTGTLAALHGGTTTIIDFANQVRGETLNKTLDDWHQKADDKAVCDYGFHISVTDVNEESLKEIKGLMDDGGVTSFKTFLAYDAMKLSEESLEKLMVEVNRHGGMITNHAENGAFIDALIKKTKAEGKLAPKYHPLTRPGSAESDAALKLLKLAEKTSCPTYIVHMSSAGTLNYLRNYREKGLKVFGETCTQYLVLDRELYEHFDFKESSKYVMSPPLRSRPDRDAMWRGLQTGVIDVIATDHCPFTTEQKSAGREDFTKIPNGAPGVEDRMEVVFSIGVQEKLLGLNQYVNATATNPAKLFGIYPQKGTLKVGSDADIIILDPAKEHKITASTRHMNCDYNAYDDRGVKGKVDVTILRGNVVIENGNETVIKGSGRYLKRNKPTFT